MILQDKDNNSVNKSEWTDIVFLTKKVNEFNRVFSQSGLLYFIVEIKANFPYKFISGDLKQYAISNDYLDLNKDSLLNLFYSADAQKIEFSLSTLHNGGRKEVQIECRLKTNVSEYRWVELRGILDLSRENKEESFTLFISDITQKKLADASLKYKMSFTNSLIDSIQNPIYYKNTVGVFLGVNTAYERILDKNRNQIIGKKIEDLIPKERIGKYHFNEDEIIKTRGTQIIEDRILYYDNTWHDVLVNRSTFVNANLTVGGIIGVINDITILKNNEKALIDSESNYRLLTSYLPEIVLVYSEGKIIFVNDVIEKKLGFKVEELINQSIFNITEASYHQIVIENVKKRSAGEMIEDYKIRLLKKSGGTLLFIVRGAPIQFMGLKGAVVVLIDITEREKADERIRNSELQFRALWENSFNGMRLVNEEGLTELVNNSYCTMVNMPKEELEGKPFTNIYVEGERKAKLNQFIERIKTNTIEAQFKRKVSLWNGKTIWVELSNSLIKIPNKKTNILSVFKDITNIVDIERQLSLSQKMESVGLLAAGIAHEINSPMQFIGDNNSFLKDSFNNLLQYLRHLENFLDNKISSEINNTEKSLLEEIRTRFDVDFLLDEIPTAIEQTQTGIERVNKIVRALKDFAHPSAKEKSLSDINHGIEVTAIISKNQWKYVADLETKLDPDLPYISCLLDEINQVILNMIINAAHAIQERYGNEPEIKGKIIIETRRTDEYIEILTEDNGTGIKSENLNKIFDPFFTTKEVGKGTGQGLSIVHDIIVKKHNGSISVDSEYGKGTVFSIKLPIN